ncbi:MAG: replication-associated recombination protein A [Proteobacteria bacterium]|nr:replication-associated recombination protein A [Pseudomonadota bacterium]
MYQPLAEILRPKSIQDIIGQQHLIGDGKALSMIVKSQPQSLILWGQPGVGKTTIANILINTWQCDYIKLSAVFSGIKEIKEALEQADRNSTSLFNKQTVIFVDEIHRFNKAQQDAFLHHLEDGKIILIGATTENPSFELNNALLSRMQVYILNPLTESDLSILLDRSLLQLPQTINFSESAKKLLISLANGDARSLLNILETISNHNVTNIDNEVLQQIIPNSLKYFDKGGEQFYNQISALHKSIRGSDPDAALYWFTRMLDGGADPLYLGRRLLRMSWEDIGLADVNAQSIANNALQTYERLGSPEGELALASCVIYLAVTPKSNSTEIAYNKVRDFIKKDIAREVPLHLRNAPTKLMAELGYGKEYKYVHDYPNHYIPDENYWPEDMIQQQFYTATNQGLESRIVERLRFLKSLAKKKK